MSPVSRRALKSKQARDEADLFDVCARLSHSPTVVAVMMVVVMMPVMVPAMPAVMVMAVVPPVHFRRRQPGILLNRRGSAGIAQG